MRWVCHGERHMQLQKTRPSRKETLLQPYAPLGAIRTNHDDDTGYVPQLFKCYIDDIVWCTECSCYDLEQYIDYVSNFHPPLQFTSAISIAVSWYHIEYVRWQVTEICTTRELTCITIMHNYLLISARGQFPTVSFFDFVAGSAVMMLILWTEPQR